MHKMLASFVRGKWLYVTTWVIAAKFILRNCPLCNAMCNHFFEIINMFNEISEVRQNRLPDIAWQNCPVDVNQQCLNLAKSFPTQSLIWNIMSKIALEQKIESMKILLGECLQIPLVSWGAWLGQMCKSAMGDFPAKLPLAFTVGTLALGESLFPFPGTSARSIY